MRVENEIIVLGTYGERDAETLERMIRFASERGVMLVDTAKKYGNEQAVMRAAGAAGMAVGTKVDRALMPGATLDLLEKTVRANGGAAIKRVMMHNPLPLYVWRELEAAVDKGLAESIGLCNVDVATLQSLLEVAKVTPSVAQGELHAFLPDLEKTLALAWFCENRGIAFEAHSVLGGMRAVLRATAETPLKALARALGVEVGEAARDLVRWVRVTVPYARICVRARTAEHLDDVITAATEDTAPLRHVSGVLSPFRLYPIGYANPLAASIEGGDARAELASIVLFAGETVSETVVQVVSDHVQRDLSLLNSSDGEEASWEKARGSVSRHLYGKKGRDVNLFTRVAVRVFGVEGVADADLEQASEEALLKIWATDAKIASAVTRLRTALVKLRSRLDKKPIRSCAHIHILNKKSGDEAESSPTWSCAHVHVLNSKSGDEDMSGAIRSSARIHVLNNKSGDEHASSDGDLDMSEAVAHPTPMPVDVPVREALDPYFEWLSGLEEQPGCDVQFRRGALLAGGHLDMCKQVVGPAHMARLCETVQRAARRGVVRHFLLGNNVAFEQPARVTGKGAGDATAATRQAGIDAMLELMNPRYGIETWYLAGNCIDGDIAAQIADALSDNDACISLWLKRNPLGPRGGSAMGRLLARNTRIQLLDLHNTGLGDEGMRNLALEAAARPSPVLNCLHLGANGLTRGAASDIAQLLRIHVATLESVYVDMNPLGDDGVALILDALAASKVLRRLSLSSTRMTDAGLEAVADFALRVPSLQLLDVGYYKSTRDLGERFNHFADATPLIRLVSEHPGLKWLKASQCGLPVEEAQRLVAAAAGRGGVSVTAGDKFSTEPWTRVMAHGEEELVSIRQPDPVRHIFSIYRNNM